MILDTIVAAKRAEVQERSQFVPLADLTARVSAAPKPLDFAGAIGPCKRSQPTPSRVALIAEIKRASPSRGVIQSGLDPVSLSRVYADNGACAISVLTDTPFFRGSLDDLSAVRRTVAVPILRKEFIIDEYQIWESRAFGADAILLITRILTDIQVCEYLALAESLDMAALVEAHNEVDVELALDAGARIIGINNRNLEDFNVDLATTERLAPRVPGDCILVAESGISRRGDVDRVAGAGADAVLVGEALVRADDPIAKVKELSDVSRKARG